VKHVGLALTLTKPKPGNNLSLERNNSVKHCEIITDIWG
jgi:hypothetical protein